MSELKAIVKLCIKCGIPKHIIIQSVKRISMLMPRNYILQPLCYKRAVSTNTFWFQTKLKTCVRRNVSAKNQDCNDTQKINSCSVCGSSLLHPTYFIWNELLVPLWSRSCDKQATNNANFSSGVKRFPNSSTCNPKIQIYHQNIY